MSLTIFIIVIGFLVLIAIIFIVWSFCMKKTSEKQRGIKFGEDYHKRASQKQLRRKSSKSETEMTAQDRA